MTKEQYRRANQKVFIVTMIILGYLMVATVLQASFTGCGVREIVRILVGGICIGVAIFGFVTKRETRQGALLLSYSAIIAYAVFTAVGTSVAVYAYVFPILFAAMAYFDYK